MVGVSTPTQSPRILATQSHIHASFPIHAWACSFMKPVTLSCSASIGINMTFCVEGLKKWSEGLIM